MFTQSFWRAARDIVDLTTPIVKVLRLADSNVPTSGKIYKAFERCKLEIQGLEVAAEKKARVLEIFEARRVFVLSDLHIAGYVLDPEFRKDHQLSIPEVAHGWVRTLARLIPDAEKRALMVQQYAMYKSGVGLFANEILDETAKKLASYQWWESWGAEVPELQKLAMRLTSQPTSASSCERNWSLFDYIHNKKRNRLSVEKSSDLVYVFSNLRLRKKVQDVDFEEAFVGWNSDSGVDD